MKHKRNILVGLIARSDGRWSRRGPWDLGRWSSTINVIAVLWIAGFAIVSCLPPNFFVAELFAILLAALGVYWFASVRSTFGGPPGGAA